MVWSIWKHKNECKFTNAQPNFDELQELIKVRVALWIKSKVAGICYSVQGFVSRCAGLFFLSSCCMLESHEGMVAEWWLLQPLLAAAAVVMALVLF
ncbi:hypothetical protein ACSBR1_019129 [Camellia fascicularis]